MARGTSGEWEFPAPEVERRSSGSSGPRGLQPPPEPPTPPHTFADAEDALKMSVKLIPLNLTWTWWVTSQTAAPTARSLPVTPR